MQRQKTSGDQNKIAIRNTQYVIIDDENNMYIKEKILSVKQKSFFKN